MLTIKEDSIKMNRKEAREIVMKTLRRMSLESLIEKFELTESMSGAEVFEVRGWLMDAIEEKNPDGFSAWLDTKAPQDSDLRKYVLG